MTSMAAPTAPAEDARARVHAAFEAERRALTGYCYRMLGSGSEADDAVQETWVRAWQAADGFEGRSSLRSWFFRIATNVCIDMGRSGQRRARPMDLGPARDPDPVHLADVGEPARWITPIADDAVIDRSGDPADVAVARDTIRLAFVAALQFLPARQRAAVVLCEVLRWPAAEVADLLTVSTASVHSALQRARATLAEAHRADTDGADAGGADTESGDPTGAAAGRAVDASPLTPAQTALLARYLDAFERYDLDEIGRLVHDDVVQSMPPYAMWLRGRDDLLAWWAGPGRECEGSRLLAGWANGCPAYAQYRRDPGGGHAPWALQVIELRDDRIAAVHSFLDTAEVFPRFGFPTHL